MSTLKLTFLGTGGAQQVPAFGCECAACLRAKQQPLYRRKPCSAMLEYNGALTLLDAGLHDLTERFTPTQISQFLLTHYHMDHVQGLFPYVGELVQPFQFMALLMNWAATIYSNIRGCLILTIG